MFKAWREVRQNFRQGKLEPVETTAQHQENAREAIPKVIGKKAKKHYVEPVTLLVYSDDGKFLLPNELSRLTEPWNHCFEAIYLLCGIRAIKTQPKLCIMTGEPPWKL